MALRPPVAMDTAGTPTSPPRPSSGPVTQLINCRLLRDGELVHDDLWIQDGVIIDPRERFFTHKLTSDHKVDLGGLIVSPGYIDIQINGAFGVDFSTCVPDELPAGLRKVAFGLLQHGVTSFLPTLMSSSPENYRRILATVQPTPGTVHNGAEILGWHLEGPFLNANVAGSHDKAYIRSFEAGRNGIHDVYGPFLDSVRIITIAPELQGALDVIQRLSRAGIVVAAGHSAATTTEAEAAVRAGVTMVTHLFNAMTQFHHREPGLAGLLGSREHGGFRRPFYSVIADGVHVHQNAIRIAYDANPKGAILVTDAISPMGLLPGTYVAGNRRMVVSDRGETYLEGTRTLAGRKGSAPNSVTPLDQCVRNFRYFTECSIVEALQAATLHPAQLLGITHRKGTLNVGADADLVVLDDDLNVRATFVRGELAYKV